MRYVIRYFNLFKRSFKKCLRRGCDEGKFRELITILSENGNLPAKYHPHKLKGAYNGYWECNITPDWLLVWEQNDNELLLILMIRVAIAIYSDSLLFINAVC